MAAAETPTLSALGSGDNAGATPLRGCGLPWEDINFERRHARVELGPQPAGANYRCSRPRPHDRTAPYRCLRHVRACCAPRDRQAKEAPIPARGVPGHRHAFTTGRAATRPLLPHPVVRGAVRKQGVRSVRLHDIRHTCVTLLLSLGVNPRIVMEIAGHSRIEMTMNVYGHVSVDSQRQALGLLDVELGAASPDTPEE